MKRILLPTAAAIALVLSGATAATAAPAADLPAVSAMPSTPRATEPSKDSADYRLVVWKKLDASGWPQQYVTSMYTNSTDLTQLDDEVIACGDYQIDLYDNSRVTDSLVEGGKLLGPSNPTEDFPDISTARWRFTSITECPTVVTPPAAAPTFTERCGTTNDSYALPADGDGYAYRVTDRRVDGVGTVAVDLVAADEAHTLAAGTTTHWEHAYTDAACDVEIAPPAKPAVTDPCGADNVAWVAIPADTEAVDWTENGDGTLSAAPRAGFTFPKVTYALTTDTNVSCEVRIAAPGTPSVTDPCGADNVKWTEIPADTESVHWSVNSDGALTASAKAGYAFPDTTYTLPADTATACVVATVPTPPAATDPCGPSNVAWAQVSTDTTEIDWTVNGDGTLTAAPQPGFSFEPVTFALPADTAVACAAANPPATVPPTTVPPTTVTPTTVPSARARLTPSPATSVTAGAQPSPSAGALPATGADDSLASGAGVAAVAMLLAGGLLLVARRRTRRGW